MRRPYVVAGAAAGLCIDSLGYDRMLWLRELQVVNARMILLVLMGLVTATAGVGCQQKNGLANGKASQPEAPTADTLGEQTIVSNAGHLASLEYSATDSAWGERLAMQCRACHSLDAGGGVMMGPALFGFFGREAGSLGGFSFSQALAESDFVWTPRALDAWLRQPARFLPGNRMMYAGLSKADDRRAVIAYLLKVTDDTGEELE
jgi:cytochrome c